MIRAIKHIKNVGRFQEVVAGDLEFARLTLIHAENGRGKSTLAAILRSLESGAPGPILERRRLGSEDSPHVVVDCADILVFENGSWNALQPGIRVFDDQFVDENVHSGLAVESEHRKNLHTWIIGSRGVSLDRQLRELVQDVEDHNGRLRGIESRIPTSALHGYEISDFCALQNQPDIDDAISEAKRRLAAFDDAEEVARHSALERLSLPALSLSALQEVLAQELPTIETVAFQRVKDHFATMGQNGESWVRQRMVESGELAQGETGICPFCAESLQGVELIDHYRAYFGEEYRALNTRIAETISDHDGLSSSAVVGGFERGVSQLVQGREFWARFRALPEFEIKTQPISECWTALHAAIRAQLQAKHDRPLDRMVVSDSLRSRSKDLAAHIEEIDAVNEQVAEVNQQIERIRNDVSGADRATIVEELEHLHGIKARYSTAISAECNKYVEESAAKGETELRRDAARKQFAEARETAFREYPALLNGFLTRFNAEFTVEALNLSNTRGGSSSNYHLGVSGHDVPLVGSAADDGDQPSVAFRNTLSSGDRRTLALAVYFAGMNRESQFDDVVAVIDDPAASLDDHRSMATAQAIVELAEQISQTIVLSHSQQFLAKVYRVKRTLKCAQLQIIDQGERSGLEKWDVMGAHKAEHDLRHARFEAFISGAEDDLLGLARCIRPHLEMFLSVVAPVDFATIDTLGSFVAKCMKQPGAADHILDPKRTNELRSINEYSAQFHHDSVGVVNHPQVNRRELRGFVQRTLGFTRL